MAPNSATVCCTEPTVSSATRSPLRTPSAWYSAGAALHLIQQLRVGVAKQLIHHPLALRKPVRRPVQHVPKRHVTCRHRSLRCANFHSPDRSFRMNLARGDQCASTDANHKDSREKRLIGRRLRRRATRLQRHLRGGTHDPRRVLPRGQPRQPRPAGRLPRAGSHAGHRRSGGRHGVRGPGRRGAALRAARPGRHDALDGPVPGRRPRPERRLLAHVGQSRQTGGDAGHPHARRAGHLPRPGARRRRTGRELHARLHGRTRPGLPRHPPGQPGHRLRVGQRLRAVGSAQRHARCGHGGPGGVRHDVHERRRRAAIR